MCKFVILRFEQLKILQFNLQVKNSDKKLYKVAMEQLLNDDDSSIAKMRFMSDSELNRRMTGEEEAPLGKQKAIPATPLWGLYETILTKKV